MSVVDPKQRKIVGILKIVTALLSLAFWTASCVLWYHYASARPSQPNTAVGQIYPEHQIEQTFYLTSAERSLWYLLAGTGVSCFLLGVGFHMFGKRLDREVLKRMTTEQSPDS